MCNDSLLKLEAADLTTYWMCTAAFSWLWGFNELNEKLFILYKAAVDNGYCKNTSYVSALITAKVI